VTGFTKPVDAIAAVRQMAPHLVLADQTMPGMTGSQMLDVIRGIAPQAVRIIISAHASQTDKIGSAHQYLSKPFDHRELPNRIQQALDAQESLSNPGFTSLVTSLQSFPALPAVYTDLLRELDGDDSAFEQTAALLDKDGGIFTRTIQMANSPLFGGTRPITRSSEALLQLGTSNVKALVLSLHVFHGYNQINFPEMPVEMVWHRSWQTAQLARELSRKELGEAAANDAFFAGLVRDLGCLILMENHTERYKEVCQRAAREHRPLIEVEKQVFEASHADLSGFMLRLWGMPEAVIDAVIHCDAPWNGPRGNEFTPTVALYMANILSRQQNPPDTFIIPELERSYLASVGAPDIRDLEESKTRP
jgi:HD-like signal output (HDOD) protein